MYGSKAAGIRNVAKATWQETSTVDDPKIDQAIFDIAEDHNIEVEALTELPDSLRHEEFIRLVIALDAAAFTG